MKKNILIIVLLIVTSLSTIIAYVKSDEAEKRGLEATINLKMAVKNHEEAMKQQELALQAAAEAKRQQQLAEEAMARFMECQNK